MLLKSFIYLNLNLIPYFFVKILQHLVLLANLEFCLIFNFFNHGFLGFLFSFKNIFVLILTFNEVFVDLAELLIDLLFEDW